MENYLLEKNLETIESDLNTFIESQKRSLERDKLELEKKISPPSKSQNKKNIKSSYNQDIESRDKRKHNEENRKKEDYGLSLNLGVYEAKHKRLQEERQEEYKKYLAEQQLRTAGKSTTDTLRCGGRHAVAQNIGRREDLRSQIDKEYEDLLKRKKQNETSYRVQFNEPASESKSNKKKVIEFDSDDEALFEFVKQAQQKKRRHSAKEKTETVGQLTEFKNAAVFDGRANSVPPKIPPIFGGPSELSLAKKKNQQYKIELEEQIKEKELLKAKEKLKRLGRITSDIDITDIEIPARDNKNKWALPTTKMNNAEKESPQYTMPDSQNIIDSNGSGSVPLNPYTMFMNQANPYGANPMMNHMINNVPVAWNNYGMMPNPGFVPQMMAYPNMNISVPGQSTNHRKTWQEPEQTYKPIASDNIERQFSKKPTLQPPGGVSQGLFGQPYSNDDSTSKRAQQLTYQQELQNQIDEKKKKDLQTKAERERYERKLESEIDTYDPWGKGGGGAPVRNQDGKVMADLRKLRLKDGRSDCQKTMDMPEPSPVMKALEESQNTFSSPKTNYAAFSKTSEQPCSNTNEHKDTPGNPYARGAALKELQGTSNKSPRDKVEQDQYKLFLQQQVEEKKRKEEEAKEKARIEENKENARIVEQQKKIKEEFEREKERQRKKEEEVRKQNEELRLAAEKKRFEEERKNKLIQEDLQNDLRKEAEKKLQAVRRDSDAGNEDLKNDLPRSDSPPVPAVAKNKKKKNKHSSRQPKSYQNLTNDNSDHKQHSDSHRNFDYLNAIRKSLEDDKNNINTLGDHKNQLEKQKTLIHHLATLRNELQKQEQKVQAELDTNKERYQEMVSDTTISRTENDSRSRSSSNDVFAKATRKSLGKKNSETSSNAELAKSNYSTDRADFDLQQQEYMRQQEIRLKALRRNVDEDLNDKRGQSRGSKRSLLDSDSKFVSLTSNHEIIPQLQENRQNSARQRRRTKDTETNDLFEDFFQRLKEPEDSETLSITSTRVEEIARRNEERLRRFEDSNSNNGDPDEIVRNFLANAK